jgi:hypothetical protein
MFFSEMTEQIEKDAKDGAHTLARAVLSAIPVIGGPLSVLFESVFSPPIEKRKQEWLQRLAQSVNTLTEKIDGLTPEALSKHEVFISVALQASQIALRSHQKEKLEALQNAVLNSVAYDSLDETKQMMFVRFIDELTPLHLKVLKFRQNPVPPSKEPEQNDHPHILVRAWDEANPDLPANSPLIWQVSKDLFSRGLTTSGWLDQGPTLKKATLDFGDEFLRFISNPYEA